jgi:hypothetical protein
MNKQGFSLLKLFKDIFCIKNIRISKEQDCTYLLFLINEYNPEHNTKAEFKNIIFLGSGDESDKLYNNGLDANDANEETKASIVTWLNLVQDNLDEQEKKDLDYAFMYNPESEFSYSIKNMTLCIRKIKNLN